MGQWKVAVIAQTQIDQVKIDSLIYGTFPDLPGSQQVVYKSDGISSEIEARLIALFDSFGDCRTPDFVSALSVHWLEVGDGNRFATVTRTTQQDKDFSGRWGALLRHAAVLSEKEYERMLFDPFMLESLLITSGSAEQLSTYSGVEIEVSVNIEDHLSALFKLDVSLYRDSIEALLGGKRLVAFSDLNNQQTNSFLRELVSLLPLEIKRKLNWSEFLFRDAEDFDLALTYSSRYSAPESGTLLMNSVGEGNTAAANLPEGFKQDYIDSLAQACAVNDIDQLKEILFTRKEVKSTSNT